MPIFELHCPACHTIREEYFRHWYDQDPACPACGGLRERMASRFGVVFTGPLTARYNNPRREGAHMEGYYAYRKRSSISGQPESVFIDSWDAHRAFQKAEGLEDGPTNCTISRDGKKLESAGMPGQWTAGGMDPHDMVPSRVWEMDKSLTSIHGKDPAPQASGPPCTASAVDAGLMEAITPAPSW